MDGVIMVSKIALSNSVELIFLLKRINDNLRADNNKEEKFSGIFKDVKYWDVFIWTELKGQLYNISYGSNQMLNLFRGEDHQNTYEAYYLWSFLKEFKDDTPKVLLDFEKIYFFDTIGSSNRDELIIECNDKTVVNFIKDIVRQSINWIEDEYRREYQKRIALRKSHTKGQDDNLDMYQCPVCSWIKNREYELITGGKIEAGPISPHSKCLEILGWPKMNDDLTSSHWCLKRCVFCGTYYLWEYTYEYLVGGSEDEIILTRLSKEQAQEYLDKLNYILNR